MANNNKIGNVRSPRYLGSEGQIKFDTTSESYEAQLQAIQKELAGTRFESQFNSNPYNHPTEVHDTWFSKAGTAAREELRQKSLEYANDLLRQYEEEKYNNPVAQSERLRAAGINPDLSGDISSGAAASPGSIDSPDLAGAAAMMQEGTLTPFAVGQTILSTLSSGLGMLKQFQEIALSRNQAQAFDLENLDKIDAYARKTIYDLIPWDDVDKMSDNDVLPDTVTSSMDDVLNDSLSTSELKTLFSNPVNAHRYKSSLYRLRHSPMTKANLIALKNQYLDDREKFYRTTGSSFFSPNDDTFKSIMSAFVKYDDTIRKLTLDADVQSLETDIAVDKFNENAAEFETTALSFQNPETVGTLKEQQNLNSLSEAKQASATLKLLDDLYKSLSTGYKQGGIAGGFSAIGLVLLTFIRSQMFTNMVSQGFGSFLSRRNSRSNVR